MSWAILILYIICWLVAACLFVWWWEPRDQTDATLCLGMGLFGGIFWPMWLVVLLILAMLWYPAGWLMRRVG